MIETWVCAGVVCVGVGVLPSAVCYLNNLEMHGALNVLSITGTKIIMQRHFNSHRTLLQSLYPLPLLDRGGPERVLVGLLGLFFISLGHVDQKPLSDHQDHAPSCC